MARAYLRWLSQVRRAKDISVYNYTCVIDAWLSHLGPKDLGKANPNDFARFLTRPRGGRAAGKTAADATLAKDVSILRAFYDYLHAHELIERNPARLLVAPTVHNSSPRAIPDETWAKLWRSPLNDEARVTLGLGFFLGLRRQEIVQLKPSHLLMEKQCLTAIVAFPRKGGGDHTLPAGELFQVYEDFLPHLGVERLYDPLWRLWRDARESKRRWLLPWRETVLSTRQGVRAGELDPHHVTRHLKLWLAEADMDNAFTPHALRHSAATNLFRAGLPAPLVREVMNHTSLSTTTRYMATGGTALRDWRKGQLAELAQLRLQ
jgi:site-specific recombinase XerD